MNTREVFQILREHIEPKLVEMGFVHHKDKHLAGQFLIWTRPLPAHRFETVYCQIDKRPWDPWFGSRFRISMNRSAHAGNVALCDEYASMFQLLTATEFNHVQELQNKMIQKCRVPGEIEYNAHMGFAAYGEFMMGTYQNACLPVSYSKARPVDIWLRISDGDDIAEWARYLSAWIPDVLTREANTNWRRFQ
jgi:hypothetical protein